MPPARENGPYGLPCGFCGHPLAQMLGQRFAVLTFELVKRALDFRHHMERSARTAEF